MLFPDVSPPREQVFAALSSALAAKNTRIYLNASLLIHTYEISLGARDDLLGALETFSDRLAVPLWAANETWEHMRSKITRFPLQKAVKQLNNALDAFRTSALRYVDDETVSELTKSQYQSQLDAAMKTVRNLANPLSNHESKADLTTARLMPFIEQHRLNSDIARIVDDVFELRHQFFAQEAFVEQEARILIDAHRELVVAEKAIERGRVGRERDIHQVGCKFPGGSVAAYVNPLEGVEVGAKRVTKDKV